MIPYYLSANSGINWTTPIAHVIPSTNSFSESGDECLFFGGGFSVDLRFWWSLKWPHKIQKHKELFLYDSSSGHLISINLIKYATIIIK